MIKLIELLTRQGELLKLGTKIMKYDMNLYMKIEHIFYKENEKLKDLIVKELEK